MFHPHLCSGVESVRLQVGCDVIEDDVLLRKRSPRRYVSVPTRSHEFSVFKSNVQIQKCFIF